MAQDKILKMHLCALCIVKKPSNTYLFTYLEATMPKQQEKSNEFVMLFLAVFCLLSQDLAQKISPNIKYEFWIPQAVGGSSKTSQ